MNYDNTVIIVIYEHWQLILSRTFLLVDFYSNQYFIIIAAAM